jgi:hypothetical protein
LTEIADAHASELVAPRFEPHTPQLLARAALVLGALGDLCTEVLKPGGELVARALECAEVE